jgi:predicted RNase H-like nuclease (RuvC/YqgF family)
LTPLAERTDSSIVDLSWELGAADFIDSLAHYTPEGNRRLASALEASLASPRPRLSTEK